MAVIKPSRRNREFIVAVASELAARRESDPLATFDPHAKQKAFIDSVLEGVNKENWFIAANRAGKSDAGAFIGANFARFGTENPRFSRGRGSGIEVADRATSGWVSALDFPTSRDVIQPKYFNNGFVPPGQRHPPFIPSHEIAHWSTENQILKLKNGSIIGFKSADSGRRKYQGSEKDWFHMDEEHPWEIYEEAVIRVGSRPLIFFCTATILPPEGQQVTTSWVFPKIITPFRDGTGPETRKVFGASIYDNPGIPRDEIKRLEAIYPTGSLSRRIRMGGEWLPGIGGARAYSSFERFLNVAPQPPIAQLRPLVWTWDFNVEPMVSLVGQEDSGIYRVYKELVLDEGSIPEMVEMFRYNFPYHKGEIWIYGDATGERRTTQTGKTDYYTILNEMRSAKAAIKMRVPPDNPRVPDRINAVNRVCKDERGKIRLQIDPECTELIMDLEGVLRDGRGGILKIKNKKDPYFRRTHFSDALGYWVAYEEPVTISREASVKIGQPTYGFVERNRGSPE